MPFSKKEYKWEGKMMSSILDKVLEAVLIRGGLERGMGWR